MNSVDFWVEELTKDTSGFNVSDVYNDMSPDIRNGYGQWMWDCGYNAGLVNLQTKINTYCVSQQLLAINKAEVADKIQDLYLDNYPNPSADLEKFFHEVLRIVVNAKPLEVSNDVCND